jgi:hypothetical protein
MGTVKHWSRIAESHSDPQLKSSRRSATSALRRDPPTDSPLLHAGDGTSRRAQQVRHKRAPVELSDSADPRHGTGDRDRPSTHLGSRNYAIGSTTFPGWPRYALTALA